MHNCDYLMESDEEAIRLDLKTDPNAINEQACWAGLLPGMRVADLGCGPGKTTYYLNQIVQPSGSSVGVDISEARIDYANDHYGRTGIEFVVGDIRKSLNNLGMFDFVWIRFVLEHYRTNSFAILKNVSSLVKPGGTLCLVDLDNNCLNHFGLPRRLDLCIRGLIEQLRVTSNFDPFIGRKLYSFLYDLGFEEIDVKMTAHHLIFGRPSENDAFNWTTKVKVAAKKSGYDFKEYGGSYDDFYKDFKLFFSDQRRFTYTPLFACKGKKPLS